MGKLLDIRVSAKTYNEEDVAETWPDLVALVWPEWSSKLGLKSVDKKLAGLSIQGSPVEAALGPRPHGVVELASALPDILKFGELPGDIAGALNAPVGEVERANTALAKALGDWNTKEALDITFKLEAALSNAEEALSRAK